MFMMHTAAVLLLLTCDLYFKASSMPTGQVCPEGWHSISPFHSCFHFAEEYLDFDRAAARCDSLSSTLATIHSAKEVQLIANILTSERKTCVNVETCFQLWIGLNVSPTNDLNGDSLNWTWIRGTPVLPTQKFITMAVDALDRPPIKKRQCGALSAGDGAEPSSIIIKDCGQALRYVCRKELDCPEGFSRESGSDTCYKWIREQLTWENAAKRCQESAFGAHLAMVKSAAESFAIANYLRETFKNNNPSVCPYPNNPAIWTSGRRHTGRCDVAFVWTPFEGSAVAMNYTNWVPGQPDCTYGLELCVHLSGNPTNETVWNDLSCDAPLCSLCQLVL